jgi:hypothetical protein
LPEGHAPCAGDKIGGAGRRGRGRGRGRFQAESRLGNARRPRTLPHPYANFQNRGSPGRWHRT